MLAPGVAAYQAGKVDQAIKALSGVLTSKSASGTDLARAYYYRGLAYSKSSKPAQAIADLNNALWLKGLAPDERANALVARGKAYKAAGLESRAAQDFREAEKLAPGAASGELAAAVPAEVQAPATVELQNNQAAAAEVAAVAPATTGSTPLVLSPSTVQTTAKKATSTATVGGETVVAASSEGSASLRERGGTVSRTSSSEALSTATVSNNSGSLSSIFSGSGDFFSNIFSSGSSSEPAVTESTSVPADVAVAPKPKAALARGESADIPASTTTTASAETVVASNMPATTAIDAPLVPAPAATGVVPETDASATSFAAETTVVEPQVSSWSSTVGDEQASLATTTPAAPASSGDSASSDVGTSIGSFFEGLFSGNTQSVEATGTTQAAPAAQSVQQATQVAALDPALQPIVATEASRPTGRYKSQIATVRSPEEAELIARRMRTERKALMGNLEAEVSPVVLGNMGTFYAVLVGPFPDERASERFCGKLQGEGVDCFVAEP